MLLVLDIGNTNITLGIFDKDNLVETARLLSDKNISQKEYELLIKSKTENYKITSCIIGSVVEELKTTVKKACDNVFQIDSSLFTIESLKDFEILLENPNQVGADRIANAYAAMRKYSLPAIVVDIGTAITFDVVSKNGGFLGGVIMPGVNLQLKSLNLNTSKLPQINVGASENAIGDSTEKALLSGVIRGTACAIEGLLYQCESELGSKATVIATGGQSQLISEYMSRKFDYINPSLTLEGFKYLYELEQLRELVLQKNDR